MKEIWKDIEGFTGYKISTFGNLISNKRAEVKLLTKRINKKGYIEYKLTENGKSSYYKAHRLVAKAFIPNPENKPQVNHIDGNKQNNCVDNLEWCTNSENQIHAYKMGLKNIKYGKNHHSSIKINQYDLDGTFIKSWDCIKYASENLNIHHSNIVLCCRGVYKKKHTDSYLNMLINSMFIYLLLFMFCTLFKTSDGIPICFPILRTCSI